jgi:hypothetical protein
MSEPSRELSKNHASLPRLLLEAAFLIWLIGVNVLYYIQFKSLLLARLASLVRK